MRDCLWRVLAPPLAIGAFIVVLPLLSPLFVYHVMWGSDSDGVAP